MRIFSIRLMVMLCLVLLSAIGCSSKSDSGDSKKSPTMDDNFDPSKDGDSQNGSNLSNSCGVCSPTDENAGPKPVGTEASGNLTETCANRSTSYSATIGSSLEIKNINCPSEATITVGQETKGVKFDVPADTVSFIVHLFSPVTGDVNAVISSLTSPSSTEVLASLLGAGVNADYMDFQEGYANVMVPKKPGVPIPQGEWLYELLAMTRAVNTADINMKISLRTGKVSATPNIRFQPYLCSTNFSKADLQGALDHAKKIYSDNGINALINPVSILTESKYFVIDGDFTSAVTAELVGKGSSSTVNLFFADDVQLPGQGLSLLGIASGLPGAQGIVGNRNGVLIGLANHQQSGSRVLDPILLGETAAHESGHFLGLFHTTEGDASYHDIIDDTPECFLKDDTNHNRQLDPHECPDGANLMFWIAGDDPKTGQHIDQSHLTPDQIKMLASTPIAQ
ncbi:hypothetical protein WDW89_08380 [Deltaproteobacteria bacterium TL4]